MQILEEKLTPQMQIHKSKSFIHDGAPWHRSQVVRKFLENTRLKYLNGLETAQIWTPIKNHWNNLLNKIADKQPSSAEHLQQIISSVMGEKSDREYYSTLVLASNAALVAIVSEWENYNIIMP